MRGTKILLNTFGHTVHNSGVTINMKLRATLFLLVAFLYGPSIRAASIQFGNADEGRSWLGSFEKAFVTKEGASQTRPIGDRVILAEQALSILRTAPLLGETVGEPNASESPLLQPKETAGGAGAPPKAERELAQVQDAEAVAGDGSASSLDIRESLVKLLVANPEIQKQLAQLTTPASAAMLSSFESASPTSHYEKMIEFLREYPHLPASSELAEKMARFFSHAGATPEADDFFTGVYEADWMPIEWQSAPTVVLGAQHFRRVGDEKRKADLLATFTTKPPIFPVEIEGRKLASLDEIIPLVDAIQPLPAVKSTCGDKFSEKSESRKWLELENPGVTFLPLPADLNSELIQREGRTCSEARQRLVEDLRASLTTALAASPAASEPQDTSNVGAFTRLAESPCCQEERFLFRTMAFEPFRTKWTLEPGKKCVTAEGSAEHVYCWLRSKGKEDVQGFPGKEVKGVDSLWGCKSDTHGGREVFLSEREPEGCRAYVCRELASKKDLDGSGFETVECSDNWTQADASPSKKRSQ